MKFNQLVQYILSEAKGVDPMKFAYKGAPMGFRSDTGISNPEKFVSTNKGPGDKGVYILGNLHRILRAALLVTASDPAAGSELKRVFEQFGKVYFTYKNNLDEVKSVEDRLSKLKDPDSDFGITLKERLKEYIRLTELSKLKVDEATPDVIAAVQDLVKEGSTNFVNKLKERKSQVFKSLDSIEADIDGDNEKAAIKFLKDIYRGKSEFEPLSKFVEAEKIEGKNPAVRMLTIYKTIIDIMVKNNLVDNIEKTFNFITNQTSKVRSIAEPTAGRMAMKAKDPALLKVIAFIKQKEFDKAKMAINTTNLPNNLKSGLMNDIEKLKLGQVKEADVIRPLYAV